MLAQVSSIIAKVDEVILRPLIVVLFAAALVYFLWGTYTFIRNADSPEERKVGARHMIYGIIGMAIMFAVHSIIRLVLATFDVPLPLGV